MSQSGIRSIAKNSAYLAVAKAVGSIARVIYAVALAKFLGPEFYGMFNLGMSWYLLFLPLSMLGLNAILIREIGRDRQNSKELVGHTLAMRSVSSILTALLSFSLGYSLETDSTAKILMFIFSLALLGRGLSVWAFSLFKAYEQSVYVLKQETVFRLLEVLLGLAVMLLGGGVVEVALVHASIWILQGGVGLYFVRKHIIKIKPIWEFGPIVVLLKQGIPFVLAAFLLSWLMQGSLLVLRSLEGYTANLGLFALAMQALMILGGIIGEMSGAALPVLSRSVHRGDGKGGFFIDVILRSALLLAGVLSLSGIVLGVHLVDWVMETSYHPVAELLPWTLFWVGPYFIMMNLNGVIVALGGYNWIAMVNLVGASLFTILVIPLHHGFGVLGIAWALGAGLFAVNLAQVYVLRDSYQIDYDRAILRPLGVVLISIFLCTRFPELNAWVLLIASLLMLTVLTYVTGVVRKEEILAVKRLLRNRI